MRNNYVAYIVAMGLDFSRLNQFGWLLCVATMSSPAQLRVRDGYGEAEVDADRPRVGKCQKQADTYDACRATNQLRMAARRALEWVGMFEGPAGF